MLSYTGRRSLYGKLSLDESSDNLTLGDTLMNAAEKRILTMRPWPFLEKKDTTLTTSASTAGYELPQKVGKVYAVTITVSSQIYTPREIVSETDWNRLNQSVQTSDSVEFWYIRAGRIEFYPRPASASNTITLYYRQIPKDLSIADYTTGSIVSIAAAGTAVVGTGTTWTTKMAGRFIRFTDSDTANTGDGNWYEIASSGTATTITLLKPYAGTAIAAGTASYTIGQMSLLPEGYHELPVFEALRMHFTSVQPDMAKKQMYDQLAKEMLAQLIRDHSSKSSGVVLDDGQGITMDNPNLHITAYMPHGGQPLQIRIDSILNGQAPTQYFGSEGTYNSSLSIDPDYPISSSAIKASAFMVPIGMAEFSGANVTDEIVAIINTPKNTNTYVVLANGRLISYNSSLASETLIGTVTGSKAHGAFYYNNYIYITGTGASEDDVSRYGPLDNSPAIANNVWKGATLGTLTALVDTTYPTLRTVELPNHWGFAHSDGAAYFVDYKNGQGLLHKIKTSKTTDEGDTNDGSAYNVLDLPFGYKPVSLTNSGTDIAIIAIQGTDTTINQGDAALFLWDPTNVDSFYRGPIPLSDPLATAILNANGVLHIWSGNGVNGVRMSRYIGGDTVSEVAYQEEGTPPFPGAVAVKGNRIVWGGWTTYPAASASVFAVNSKNARVSNTVPIFNIAKTTSAGTTPLITALAFTQQSSNIQPKIVVASNDGSGQQIDQYSATGTLSAVIRFVFPIGRRFQATRLRVPFGGAVDSTTEITPKFYMDDESSNKTLTTINNTNFPSKRKVYYKSPELIGVSGENNLMLEFTWGSTTPLPIALPIILDLETYRE